MRFQRVALQCFFSVLCAPVASASEISAWELFQSSSSVEGTYSLQVDKNDTLVFRSSDPPIVLNGENLFLSAVNVRLDGQSTIRSFPEFPEQGFKSKDADDVAQAGQNMPEAGRCKEDGCNGEAGGEGGTGKQGTNGTPAGKIELHIGSVTGSGELVIANVGQGGGRGQNGGMGGIGGKGGRGMDNTCGFGGPGNGGTGGEGGWGGNGGKGGSGGRGGDIVFSAGLLPPISEGRVRLYSLGGLGGLPGDAGQGNAGGGFGDGGHGGRCGGGGKGGGNGPAGNTGDPGLQGELGSGGKVSCFDCKQQTVSLATDPEVALLGELGNGLDVIWSSPQANGVWHKLEPVGPSQVLLIGDCASLLLDSTLNSGGLRGIRSPKSGFTKLVLSNPAQRTLKFCKRQTIEKDYRGRLFLLGEGKYKMALAQKIIGFVRTGLTKDVCEAYSGPKFCGSN